VFASDWNAVTMAGAFVVGLLAGALLAVRLTRVVWDGAVRARRDADGGRDP